MLKIGTNLQDRYRIIRLLGKGGMGAVYEAIDEKLGYSVAVKEVLIELSNKKRNEQILKAFRDEARSLAKVRHKAIPYVRDYFYETDNVLLIDRHYLVMELVEGNDLGQILSRHKSPLPIKESLDWTKQVLEALDYLHTLKNPIFHRDVKPSNIKLDPYGKIKLLDFGIAKIAEVNKNPRHLQKTFVAATVDYSPVEQLIHTIPPISREYFMLQHKEKAKRILKMKTDARVDVYAIGATVYHLLTNELPVDSTKRLLDIWENNTDPLTPPHELNSAISLDLSNWILKAMSVKRRDRFVSAKEMLYSIPPIKKTAEIKKETFDNKVFADSNFDSITHFKQAETTQERMPETSHGEIPHKTRSFTSCTNKKAIGIAAASLLGLLLITGISFGAIFYSELFSSEESEIANNPIPSPDIPEIPTKELTEKPIRKTLWEKQLAKAKERRNSPIGRSVTDLVYPNEIRTGARKQQEIINALISKGLRIPNDYADLARRILDKKLVEIPLVTETYVVTTGEKVTEDQFTSFDFEKDINSPIIKLNSKDFEILSKVAQTAFSETYDIKSPNDRKRLKVKLLSSLHPNAKEILEKVSSDYANQFKRPLIINALTNSLEHQISLSKLDPKDIKSRTRKFSPPHIFGYSFDISYAHMNVEEQQYLIDKLAVLKKEGIIHASIERGLKQFFHVFVIPQNVNLTKTTNQSKKIVEQKKSKKEIKRSQSKTKTKTSKQSTKNSSKQNSTNNPNCIYTNSC